MLFLIPKMLSHPPTSIFNSKIFSGGYSPDPHSKGEGVGGEEEGERERKGRAGDKDGRGIE
jgi:hypothetical protein